MSVHQEIAKLNRIIDHQDQRIKDLHDSSNIKFLESLYLRIRELEFDLKTSMDMTKAQEYRVERYKNGIKELDSLYQKVFFYQYLEHDPDDLRAKAEAIEDLNSFRESHCK